MDRLARLEGEGFDVVGMLDKLARLDEDFAADGRLDKPARLEDGCAADMAAVVLVRLGGGAEIQGRDERRGCPSGFKVSCQGRDFRERGAVDVAEGVDAGCSRSLPCKRLPGREGDQRLLQGCFVAEVDGSAAGSLGGNIEVDGMYPCTDVWTGCCNLVDGVCFGEGSPWGSSLPSAVIEFLPTDRSSCPSNQYFFVSGVIATLADAATDPV